MGETSKRDGNEPQEPEDKKVQIVPVEQLIPGIKPPVAELVKGVNYNTNEFDDRFVSEAIRDMKIALLTPESRNALKKKFKDKVVIDLGAGDTSWAYFLSVALGSKGYVGVEKFQGDALEDTLKNVDEDTMLWYWANISKEPAFDDSFKNDPKWRSEYKPLCKLIPAAIVKGDVLSLLKRLPDASGNILTFGMDAMVLPSSEYRNTMGKEIQRVLYPDGMYITYDSMVQVEGLRDFSEEDTSGDFNRATFFVKN